MKGPQCYQMWVRGRLCRIEGYVEAADRSVGICADYLCIEDVVPVEPGPKMVYTWGADDDELIVGSLTDGEFREIEWHAATYEGLTIYRTDMVYSYHWRDYDPLMIDEHRHSQMTTEVVWNASPPSE